MLESTQNIDNPIQAGKKGGVSNKKTYAFQNNRPIFKMKQGERMGGSVPVWETPGNAREQVNQRLDMAGKKSFESHISTSAFASSENAQDYHQSGSKPFGFGDILDMVNPLQHLPLVGNIYREATGDEMRGISRIMGGAVFGGPLGAAGGAVNVAIENETGKDFTGHIQASFLSKGNEIKSSRSEQGSEDHNARLARQMNSITPGAPDPAIQNTNESSDAKDHIKDIGRRYISRQSSQFLGNSVAVTDLKMMEDRLDERARDDSRAPSENKEAPPNEVVSGMYRRMSLY